MKLNRTGRLATVATMSMATLALAACGSDNSSSGTSTNAAPTIANCPSGALSAEGSSAQANAMTEFINNFQKACTGATINYNANGSGAGIKNFNAGLVDFAGSDSALNATKGEIAAATKRCAGNPAWNLPMVVGPIAVAYNVSGVDKLVLNGEVTAKIFVGAISKWNDPAIAALNSGVTLPDTAIAVFFRSDDSGTTENFTKYLSAAGNGAWTAPPAKTWAGKVGEGKPQSAGVQQAVKATANSIGYMEWSFARDAAVGIAQIDNGGGAVTLSGDSASKALESATVAGTGNDLALKLDYATKTAGAYPIVLVTYEIVCSKGLAQPKADFVKTFLTYTSGAGQKILPDLGYAPLPASIATKVAASAAALS